VTHLITASARLFLVSEAPSSITSGLSYANWQQLATHCIFRRRGG
jgi:hypothetical protein